MHPALLGTQTAGGAQQAGHRVAGGLLTYKGPDPLDTFNSTVVQSSGSHQGLGRFLSYMDFHYSLIVLSLEYVSWNSRGSPPVT